MEDPAGSGLEPLNGEIAVLYSFGVYKGQGRKKNSITAYPYAAGVWAAKPCPPWVTAEMKDFSQGRFRNRVLARLSSSAREARGGHATSG
jgi:hypothetical protein